MNIKFISLICVIVLNMFVGASAFAVDVAKTAPAAPRPFTPAELKVVDELVQGMAQNCKQYPLLGGKSEPSRMMGQWISTSEVCACQGKKIRSVLTPAVLALGDDELRDFVLKFAITENADCIVPAFKEQFAANCENFLASGFGSRRAEVEASLKSRGYDLDTHLASTCSCLRPAVQEISTKAWMESSLASYNAYLERKRTGNQSLPRPKSAFDQAMTKCSVPLPDKNPKASVVSPTLQPVEATKPEGD